MGGWAGVAARVAGKSQVFRSFSSRSWEYQTDRKEMNFFSGTGSGLVAILSIPILVHSVWNSTVVEKYPKWPLTIKFYRVTWLFPKIDMGHGTYRHEKKYYRHDIGHSFYSTCDMRPFKN